MTQQRKTESTAMKPLGEGHVKRLKKHGLFRCCLSGCALPPVYQIFDDDGQQFTCCPKHAIEKHSEILMKRYGRQK